MRELADSIARAPLRGALVLAAAYGVGLVVAIMLGPVVHAGPSETGFASTEQSIGEAARIWTANLGVLVLFGGLAFGLRWWAWVRGYEPLQVARDLLVLLAVVCAFFYVFFVSGAEALAASEGTTRPRLLGVMVHGYVEFPALFLPWTGCAAEQLTQRRDARIPISAAALGVALLLAGALIEAYVSPGLLRRVR
jgi:hypothetical protein